MSSLAPLPGHGGTSSTLADFWKDDFAPLQSAGRVVLQSLREEEAADDADLFRRMSSSGVGSHLYFASTPLASSGIGSSSSSNAHPRVTATVQHLKSVPLPPLLAQELKGVKSTTFMGLLTPASLAWMSVDDKVFLWPFQQQGSFCSFQVPSGQSIITVGLIRPRKGVFKPSVEWCLVVTTADEVILCALAQTQMAINGGGAVNNGGGNSMNAQASGGGLRLIPTSFRLATDNVQMLSVCGTESGRIFMGGDDGCLYEMTYEGLMADHHQQQPASVTVEERLNQFYDEGGDEVPTVMTIDNSSNIATEIVAMGKRTWNAISTSSSSSNNHASYDGMRPHKCRKLNRTSSVSSWVSGVLPDLVVKTGSLIFGQKTSTGGGSIERMQVDEDRECLYALSSDGWICSFDLRSTSPGKESVRLAAVMKTPRTVRLYLEAVSRGQMLPPATSGSTGYISFPGGSAAVQAGVSGMEGARAILKAADLGAKTNGRSRHVGDSILKPISIHVVPPTESQRLTLMAITEGGLRLYISSLASNVLSSGTNAASGRQFNPLSPSSRLTLCHIRAPPPADIGRLKDLSSLGDAGVLGGIKPQVIVGSAEKISRVDATYYKQGILIAAVENRAKQQGGIVGQTAAVGDIVVTSCPDSVARKIESVERYKEHDKQVLSVPGGITETTSMPMLSAYGVGTEDANAILPGGLVWDIAPVGDEETAVVKLTWNSQTPTDNELSIGLPPAYFPPSKVRARDIRPLPIANGGLASQRSSSNAVAVAKTSLSSTAIKVFYNVLTNALMARPIREGITFQPPSLQNGLFPGADLSREYRVSRRNGSSGFSTTAAEKTRYPERNYSVISRSPSKAPLASKSARLRPWLLRPAAVPLNQFSTQHLAKPRQVVALNAGGLHYFGINSILFNLADALTSAGQNVETDPSVSSFFASYGFKEGCAMCLALAIGCGPAAGNARYSERIRLRASASALARAYVPKLVIMSDQASATTSASDSLVPPGYEFHASELCKGLTVLVSRLVRPVWHKPAVVVTEGRTIKQQWSSRTRSTPAKVEVLLSDDTLEEIRGPLRNLVVLMKNMFSRAVRTVPGAPQYQGSMMDIEGESGESQFLTRALQYRSHLRVGNGGSTNQLAPAEAESIARLIEEKNIHSLYRLLSRVVQLLNLISLLQRAQSLSELKEVDWGLLHGLTISQLVQTPDGQARLESLLNSLVTTSAASAAADQLANQFAGQCYLFFSPGSRSAYLGIRYANEAMSCPMDSSRRTSLGNLAADHLRRAAKHWHSAPLVTGRILHPTDQENYAEIAFRANQYGSPLAKASEALILLGDVASVVDVCLLTASNFSESFAFSISAADEFDLDSNIPGSALPWEQHLYHKRRDPETNETSTSSHPASPSSPTQVVAYGATVTSKDAIDTCYALIFHHLAVLLSSNPQLADRMVSACAAANEDSFLSAFFQFLLESNNADTLLRINSPGLDKWLRVRNDPDLRWRYYNVQGKHFEAAEVSWDRANDSSLQLSLDERIGWLSRNLNALNAGIERGQPVGNAFGSADDLQRKVKEASDHLQIANIQNRILHSALSLPSELDLTAKLERLEISLVPVSELFNDFAAALGMYEHCLSILHICDCDDVATIEKLWKNVVCEEIFPCATRIEDVFNFLQQFAADLGQENAVTFLYGSVAANSLMLFESGDWSQRLEKRIVELGKQLYSNGTDYVFPIDLLLNLLEELRDCVGSSIPANWPLFVLSRVGVPFIVILDAYESFIQQDERNFMGTQGDSYRRMEHIASIVDLIEYWVASARIRSFGGDGANDMGGAELSRAVASGRLMSKIDALRSKLETMPNSSGLLLRIRAVEESIQIMAL